MIEDIHQSLEFDDDELEVICTLTLCINSRKYGEKGNGLKDCGLVVSQYHV